MSSTYKQGHHHVVTANHKLRTAEVEGAFLLPYLKTDFNILDIGCGPGSITTGFAKYVPDGFVTGIDLTDDIIKQAHARLADSDSRPQNVSFRTGNVLQGLPFADGAFDVIFCSQTLIHIPEPVKAMVEMKRLCKKDGLVACREGDWPFRFYPELPGLHLFHKYMWIMVHGALPPPSGDLAPWSPAHPDNAPHPPIHRSGSMVHVWARQAGFDPKRMVKKASTQVWASEEERKWYAEAMVGRLEEAGHREKFVGLGAREGEVDGMVEAWREWGEDVDGWFAVCSCEVVCWNGEGSRK